MITAADIKEIIEKQYVHCPGCLMELSEISKDEAHNQSMIPSSARFYNYDKICQHLFDGGDQLKSTDMIIVKDDELIFVEFKNGRIEGIEKKCEIRGMDDECQRVKWDIKLKSIEGAFIALHLLAEKKSKVDFSEIIGLKKKYTLVYNPGKNDRAQNNHIKTIHDHAGSYKIRFGLRLYVDRFFIKVATIPPERFLIWLEEEGLIDKSELNRCLEEMRGKNGRL
ncbi:MAG TPA: hypothetical protein VK469_23220 [Candidatus Kapabacteria bacterium]|nr:hypothetical protein [Candidatus Kapabacteria bacterium]